MTCINRNRSICDTDAEKSAVDELSGNKARSAIPANATARMSRSRMQLKDPLDMSNPQYLEALKSRQKTAEGIDYLNDNIVSSAFKIVFLLLLCTSYIWTNHIFCVALLWEYLITGR